MSGGRVFFACAAVAATVGCATLPEYRDEPVTTAEIVRHVRCELRGAIRSDPRYRWLLNQHGKGWNARLSFTFEVNHSGDISIGESAWNFPLTAGGTFNLSLTGGVKGTGNRRENIEFDQKLTKLDADPYLACSTAEPSRYARLGGRLGIADLLERATLSRPEAYNDYTKMGYDLEFAVVRNASLTPRFSVIPIGGKNTFGGNARWIGTNSDTQKLSLTFTPPARDKEEVCSVVSDPNDPSGWADPKSCPTPVYQVKAVTACQFLPSRDACAARQDCTFIPAPGGKEACAPVCGKLSQNQCNARSDCKWMAETKTCAASARNGERRMLTTAPFLVRTPAAPPAGSVSPADREALDRASSRNVLESIESDLRRQRIGN